MKKKNSTINQTQKKTSKIVNKKKDVKKEPIKQHKTDQTQKKTKTNIKQQQNKQESNIQKSKTSTIKTQNNKQDTKNKKINNPNTNLNQPKKTSTKKQDNKTQIKGKQQNQNLNINKVQSKNHKNKKQIINQQPIEVVKESNFQYNFTNKFQRKEPHVNKKQLKFDFQHRPVGAQNQKVEFINFHGYQNVKSKSQKPQVKRFTNNQTIQVKNKPIIVNAQAKPKTHSKQNKQNFTNQMDINMLMSLNNQNKPFERPMQEQMVGATYNKKQQHKVNQGGNRQDSLNPDQRIEWKGKNKKKQSQSKPQVEMKSRSVQKKSIGNPYHRSIFEQPPKQMQQKQQYIHKNPLQQKFIKKNPRVKNQSKK